MARFKATRNLGDIASGVIRKADTQGKRYGAKAVAVWREVVGPDIAIHTRGFALRKDKEFVVFVDSAAWANQLSLMSSELLERLNAHLGQEMVGSLRFTVSKKVKQEADWEAALTQESEAYKETEPGPIALDEIELRQAEHVAAAISEPSLREAALRVMVKDLELKKGARADRATRAKNRRSEPLDGPSS